MPDAKANSMRSPAEVFSKELSSRWPDYQPRDGQLALSESMMSLIREGGIGLFEAGTGTGKTLSYLVPAFLGDGPIVVSTGTKNLQDQILFKDLPVLQEIFPERRVTLLKGRANYLCVYRLKRHLKTSQSNRALEAQLIDVRTWSSRTATGS